MSLTPADVPAWLRTPLAHTNADDPEIRAKAAELSGVDEMHLRWCWLCRDHYIGHNGERPGELKPIFG